MEFFHHTTLGCLHIFIFMYMYVQGGHGNPLQYSCLQNYGLWGHKVSDTTERLSIPQTTLKGFPGGSGGKQSVCNAEDEGSIPGLDR